MPSRTERRVLEIGTSRTRAISLPRALCDGLGWSRGTNLDLWYDGEAVLVLPKGRESEAVRAFAALREGAT